MTTRATLTLLLTCGAATVPLRADPPPFTISSLARTGNPVTGTGSTINSGNEFPPFGGPGFFHVNVNNSGDWIIDADTRYNHNLGFTMHQAILRTQAAQGPFSPYILQGAQGFVSVPSATSVVRTFISQAMNNANAAVFAVGLAPNDADPQDSTGLLFGTGKIVFLAGDLVQTAGLDAGTTFDAVTSSIHLSLNDSLQLLVATTATELGASKRIVLRLQLDAAGNVLSRTLIAKVGGPVGAGPATWTAIGAGPHAAAMNNSGVVVFTGTTSAAADGIYSTAGGGSFVVSMGGPTPIAGTTWGSLLGAPLDINNPGVVAFKGSTGAGSGIYTETGDAGEVMDSEASTYGNGPLNLISGTLTNDQDADWFRIRVTDAATFSATTVPDPGSGFPGAAFDTVLTLISDPGETSSAGGRTQCDNVSPAVPQSTITGAGGIAISGRSYFLSISTPKSRIGKRIWHYATNTYPIIDGWYGDPSGLAIGGGLLHWPDPSAQTIARATTAGAAQTALTASSVVGHIAINSTAGKIYWADSTSHIRRSNLDGTVVEDVIGGTGSTDLSAFAVTGLAVDAVRGRLYWTRSVYGEVNSADLDGTNASRVVQDYPPTGGMFPVTAVSTGTLAPESISIDTSAGTAGKIYWFNSVTNAIERCDLSPMGENRAVVIAGASAAAVAIDSAAGKIYWTQTAAGKVRRANLDGTSPEDVVVTPFPAAMTLDVAGGFVYWTSIIDRRVSRASIAGALPAAPADVLALSPDVGERAPDGPSRPYTGYLNGWTRYGTAGATALPYQIRLTGASPQFAQSLIVKGNTKVAAVGDPVAGVANSVLTQPGLSGSPVKISDRGDVLWSGVYFPVIANNVPANALFLNQDRLLSSNDVPTGPNMSAQKHLFYPSGPSTLDVSDDGRYAIVRNQMQDSPYNFTTQRDNALLFQFDFPTTGACCNGTACTVVAQASCTGAFKGSGTTCLAPGNPTTCCPANFDGLNGVTVSDIFSFLTAWFAGNPAANFDGAGGVTVSDIFAFLTAWFAGCA